jgi:hypothetical protein
MPDGILERSRAEMILLGCPASRFVLDFIDPPDDAAGRLAHEAAFPAEFIDQVMRDVPELSGEVLMDVQNMHEYEVFRC